MPCEWEDMRYHGLSTGTGDKDRSTERSWLYQMCEQGEIKQKVKGRKQEQKKERGKFAPLCISW